MKDTKTRTNAPTRKRNVVPVKILAAFILPSLTPNLPAVSQRRGADFSWQHWLKHPSTLYYTHANTHMHAHKPKRTKKEEIGRLFNGVRIQRYYITCLCIYYDGVFTKNTQTHTVYKYTQYFYTNIHNICVYTIYTKQYICVCECVWMVQSCESVK